MLLLILIIIVISALAAVLFKRLPGCSFVLLIGWDLFLIIASFAYGWDTSATISALAPWVLFVVFALLYDRLLSPAAQEIRAFENSVFYEYHNKYIKSFKSENPKDAYEEMKRDPGLFGEYQVFKELNQLPGEKRFLFSLITPDGDDEFGQETDIVMFWDNCMNIIEVKNYKGSVKGNKNSDKWYHGEEEINSPVYQNHQHELSVLNVLNQYGLSNEYSYRSAVLFTESVDYEDVSNSYPYDVKYNNIGNLELKASDFREGLLLRKVEPKLGDVILTCYDILNSLQKHTKEEILRGKRTQSVIYARGESQKKALSYYSIKNSLYRTNGLYWEMLTDRGGDKLDKDNWRWQLVEEPGEEDLREKKLLSDNNSNPKGGYINDEVNQAFLRMMVP